MFAVVSEDFAETGARQDKNEILLGAFRSHGIQLSTQMANGITLEADTTLLVLVVQTEPIRKKQWLTLIGSRNRLPNRFKQRLDRTGHSLFIVKVLPLGGGGITAAGQLLSSRGQPLEKAERQAGHP
eukprot:scaffold46599_cov57-Cyclotella_meneghiniana.AAC.2